MLEKDKKMLRVNMRNMTVKWENVPDLYTTLGGRALTSSIVHDEVPPLSASLGRSNKLIVAPGVVTGTTAPTTGRLSVGAKSPLTGGIKESNAGGRTPHKLARSGVKALIIEDKPSDNDAWYNIIIKHNDAQIVQANEYYNKGAYQVIKELWEKYPNKPGVMGCSIAGQKMLKGAGIFGNNVENSDPGRYAGRGGLGAVLGSKKVIAIVTDDINGEIVQARNKDKFRDASNALKEALQTHAVTGDNGGLQNYGTNILQNIINEAGGLPTKNWTSGHSDIAAKISGEAVHERVDLVLASNPTSEAKYGHECHPGCVIKCSNAVPRLNANGEVIVSPLEYESAWALGTNCGIGNLDQVSELNRLCNDLGLDTIETGNAIAVAMEGGVIPYGDGEAAINLLKKVGEPSDLGRIIGSGAVTVGQVYGVSRVAAVKGQSMPAYDPRAIKGIGVTFATTPMGADHTAGYTIAAEILGIKGQVTDPKILEKSDLSRAFQETTAFIDSTGYCLFTAFAILDIDSGFQGMVDTFASVLDINFTLDDVTKYGRKVLDKEITFNRKAGISKEQDRLPEFMYKEAIDPLKVTFDVPNEELDKVHANHY